MKKLNHLFIPLLLCLFAVTVSAQDFGLRAGINLANVTGDVEGNSMKIGFQFGPVVDYALTENLGLHAGLLYSMKGAKDDASDNSIKSDYLDIPILVRFAFGGGLYAEVGPQFSMLLSAKAGDFDVKDSYSSMDLGAIIGLGYDLGTVRVDARYGLGLSNVIDSAIADDDSVKNTVITIGATYMF